MKGVEGWKWTKVGHRPASELKLNEILVVGVEGLWGGGGGGIG